MADAPWRCSQCGTVNEPNANACRSCGRWPSLFDLERSAVDSPEPEDLDPGPDEAFPEELPPPAEVQSVPVEAAPRAESEPDDPDAPKKPVEWRGPENPLDRPAQGWPRVASWIVPILFVLYFVISAIVNR